MHFFFMTKIPFSERLGSRRPIIANGSVGRELLLRGVADTPPEAVNLRNPVIIEQIYRDFQNAGAELLQTVTLTANRLALERYGLADKVYEINRKGVWIARSVALHKGYVAGVVGPTRRFFAPIGTLSQDEARQVFIEQIIALLDSGADILMFKSFTEADELELAVEAARFVNSEVPIIALKTFPEDGAVLSTSFPAEVTHRIAAMGVTAVGSSGTVGPQRMLDIIKAVAGISTPICALPDIAIPTLIDGKKNYNAEPDYVAQIAKKLVEAGAAITGADGGATVEHIRAISEAVKDCIVGEKRQPPKAVKVIQTPDNVADERSEFARNIGRKFLKTLEVEIPRGLDMSSVIETARYLKKNGIDAVNVFDGARARVRISPLAISHLLQTQAEMECITHITCRDRNLVGLQSDLIGAAALGLRNILAVTGDPTSIGDYPAATSVYDVDSIGLIRAANHLNSGRDLAGNQIGGRTQFLLCCACNPCADDLDREIRRLEQKVAEGATVAFSQPVFEYATLENFLNRIAHLRLNFMVGVIPLRSVRHAEFLHYEVPGMITPEWVRRRMKVCNSSPEAAMREGMNIAIEFLRQAKSAVQGVYIMPPAKKYEMAIEMLAAI